MLIYLIFPHLRGRCSAQCCNLFQQPVYLVEEGSQNTDWEGNETEHVHRVEDMEPVSMVTGHPWLVSKATGAVTWDLSRLYLIGSGKW